MSASDELRESLAHARQVLFLCSGNMLRSAFAELLARHLGFELPVLSGATTYRNDSIHPRAAAALLARGVPEPRVREFRPTHLSSLLPDLSEQTLILGMTHEHLDDARAAGCAQESYLLSAALGSCDEIEDPFFNGRFEPCFARVAACVEALMNRPG